MLFPDHRADQLQRLIRQLKAASGIDHFQNAEFTCDIGEHLSVQRKHLFPVPGIVVDVVTKAALAPCAGAAFEKNDLSLIFIRDTVITLHDVFLRFSLSF